MKYIRQVLDVTKLEKKRNEDITEELKVQVLTAPIDVKKTEMGRIFNKDGWMYGWMNGWMERGELKIYGKLRKLEKTIEQEKYSEKEELTGDCQNNWQIIEKNDAPASKTESDYKQNRNIM